VSIALFLSAIRGHEPESLSSSPCRRETASNSSAAPCRFAAGAVQNPGF
jgi:hypothetical protein